MTIKTWYGFNDVTSVFISHDTAGWSSELLGGIFQKTLHDQKMGDFLGIASASLRRRILLLLGHDSRATDGPSITLQGLNRVSLL